MKRQKKKIKSRFSVERPHNMGTLTKSGFFSKIRSVLRGGFRYYKPMMEALKLASRPSQNKSNRRLKTEFLCAICGQWNKRADVQIDHKVECGSLSDWDDVVPFIKRLTAENPDDYQILCKECHIKKTIEYKKNKKELEDGGE